MASQAHCAFCFETLSASFDRRQPLSLRQVEELWEQYVAARAGLNPSNGTERGKKDEDDANLSAIPGDVTTRSSLPTRSGSSSGQDSAGGSSGDATPARSHTSLSSRASGVSASPHDKFPLFVTWNTLSRSSRGGEPTKSLRGCIGTFEPLRLEQGLRSYALTSAFEDGRFPPIPSSQLSRLSAHVTLLTDFAPATPEPLGWTLGRHGLRISFTHRGRRLGSTYLPDVAREQGWTRDETMASLMRKAGWSGTGDWRRAWIDGRGELVTYEGKQVSLEYAEWRRWRDWVDAQGFGRESLN